MQSCGRKRQLAEGVKIFLHQILFWSGRAWWGGSILALWMMHASTEGGLVGLEDSAHPTLDAMETHDE